MQYMSVEERKRKLEERNKLFKKVLILDSLLYGKENMLVKSDELKDIFENELDDFNKNPY